MEVAMARTASLPDWGRHGQGDQASKEDNQAYEAAQWEPLTWKKIECVEKKVLWYNELSHKNRFQSVPIAVLCLYKIQRENLVFKKFLCMFFINKL